MQLSYAGKKFLEEREGFSAVAYRDSAGVWTIGFGTTRIKGKPVLPGMVCTQAEAEIWLEEDTATVQTALNKVVRVPLRQQQFDALVSFVYNIGIAAFLGSTMLKMINAASFIDAANQFKRWDMAGGRHIPGLYTRRLLEADLFQK